jgi:hypothetical protein
MKEQDTCKFIWQAHCDTLQHPWQCLHAVFRQAEQYLTAAFKPPSYVKGWALDLWTKTSTKPSPLARCYHARCPMVGWFPPKRVVLRPCSYPFAFANQVKKFRESQRVCVQVESACMRSVSSFVCKMHVLPLGVTTTGLRGTKYSATMSSHVQQCEHAMLADIITIQRAQPA